MPITKTPYRPTGFTWVSSPSVPIIFPAGADIAIVESPVSGQKLQAHDNRIVSIHWVSEGTRVLSVSIDGTIKIWDPITLEPLKKIPLDIGVYTAAVSPDGNHIAVGCENNSIKIINIPLARVTAELIGHVDAINALEWSPDGLRLFSGGKDNALAIWDVKYKNISRKITLDGWINNIKVNKLETSVAVCGIFPKIYLVDAVSLQVNAAMDTFPNGLNALRWSSSSNELFGGGMNGELQFWKFKYGRIYEGSGTIRAHGKKINAIDISSDGTLLATASDDQTIRLYKLPNITLERVALFDAPITSLAWAPEGNTFAAGDSKGTLYLLVPENLQVPKMVSFHEKPVTALAISPDGKYAASASEDKVLIVWDVRSGNVISRTLLPEPATDMKWDVDGKYINVNNKIVFQFLKL